MAIIISDYPGAPDRADLDAGRAAGQPHPSPRHPPPSQPHARTQHLHHDQRVLPGQCVDSVDSV